jgi:hypothetical protein
MERRTVLKLFVLGGFVPAIITSGQQEESAGKSGDTGKNQLQFLTEQENELLDQLMEMIIPGDGHSPGAHAAKVSLFADLMIVTSSDEVKQQWRRGLQLIREEAARSNLQQALDKSAAHEDAPSNELEHFFVKLKAMTVQGYYTSSIGIHDDLQYQGNTYVESFPGCATGLSS